MLNETKYIAYNLQAMKNRQTNNYFNGSINTLTRYSNL